MTDADLMDADCIHGNLWFECDECWRDVEIPPVTEEVVVDNDEPF